MNIFEVIIATKHLGSKNTLTTEEEKFLNECKKFQPEMEEFFRLKDLSDVSEKNFVKASGVKDIGSIIRYEDINQELKNVFLQDNFNYITYLEKPLPYVIEGLKDYLIAEGKGDFYITLGRSR